MVDELVRLQLEMAILDAGSEIEVSHTDLSWLDSPEWDAFQHAYRELVRYYGEQGDTVIGPIALGEYTHFARFLRKILLYEELDKARRQLTEDALASLEYWMDEIIKETMTNLRYLHPELHI